MVRDLDTLLDGSRKIYWYVNGLLKNSASVAYTAAVASSLDFLLGDGYTSNFIGKMPVAKIYNKPLTASEVLSNFNVYKNRYSIT